MEWSLATFHASAFVLAIVFFLYSRDALGPALGGLNTLVGLGLFLALWATTYLTTCRALEGLDLLREGDQVLFARRAFRWGAANGMAFLGVLGVVLIASAVFVSPTVLLPVLFVAPFALLISAVVGALVGLIFSAVDLALLALARGALDVR
ncbi:MAG: hypothetical protein E6J09_09710 [Chloroflexi bacterium]|nr:MAG: hypothetical protein E6J09_09710 [Chloroflexota bacterium]